MRSASILMSLTLMSCATTEGALASLVVGAAGTSGGIYMVTSPSGDDHGSAAAFSVLGGAIAMTGGAFLIAGIVSLAAIRTSSQASPP